MTRDAQSQLDRGAAMVAQWGNTWGIPGFVEEIHLEWSSRLKRTAGRAYPHQDRVRLNVLLQQPEFARYFDEVLCHEVAHLAVHRFRGDDVQPHGDDWRRLVHMAGYTPRKSLAIDVASDPEVVDEGIVYEHGCTVCHALRISRRPHPAWHCVDCQEAGLEGTLRILSRPAQPEVRDA